MIFQTAEHNQAGVSEGNLLVFDQNGCIQSLLPMMSNHEARSQKSGTLQTGKSGGGFVRNEKLLGLNPHVSTISVPS